MPDRPHAQRLTASNDHATSTQPGVYTDERDSSHPIGATMVPWRDTAHLGPSATEEATDRSRAEPDSPFVREELAALGLSEILPENKTPRPLARVDISGVSESWAGLGAEFERIASTEHSTRQLEQLAMRAVDRLSTDLDRRH